MRRTPFLLFALVFLFALDARATWRAFSSPRRTGPAENLAGAVVASNGFDYLAAWTALNWSPMGVQTYAVYATQVRADGTVYGSIALSLDTESQVAHGVSLTPGRDGYFAAWVSEKGLRAAILDSYGRVERMQTVPQDDSFHNARTIAAWDGTTYAVVSGFASSPSTQFSATLLDNNGNLVGSGIPIGDTHGDQVAAAITADSAGFLILATHRTYSPAIRDDIYARRLSPNGTTGEWFPVRSAASVISGITVVPAGSRDIIAWSDQFGIWMMELDPQTNAAGNARQLSPVTGAVVTRAVYQNGITSIAYQTSLEQKNYVIPADIEGGAGTPVELGQGYRAEIASNGSKILSVRVGRNDAADVGNGVIGKFANVSPAADFIVAKNNTNQQSGSLASNGNEVLAVWSEVFGNTRSEIFAARFDSKGTPLDGAGVQISSGGLNNLPVAAFNGHDWLIAWVHYDQKATMVARRFSSAGMLLDSADIVLGDATTGSRGIASDGTNWLVVWPQSVPLPACANFGSSARIAGGRVSPDGVALDPGGRILAPGSKTDQFQSDVAFDGSKYVATWTDQCSGWHQPTYTSVTAAFMSTDLARVDVLGVSGGATATGKQLPKVVSNAGRSLVAWTEVLGSSISTPYRLIDAGSVPQPGRVRAVGTGNGAIAGTADGSFVGTSADADGTFLIVTKKATEWVAGTPPGLFVKRINSDGVQVATGFSGLIGDAPFPGHDESFSGKIVVQQGQHWIADSWFDLAGAATRFWMRGINY